MKNFKKKNIQTTLGDLITALSEEIRPFLRSERATSIVVGYIFNDLVRRSVPRKVIGERDIDPRFFFPLRQGR
jgi:hypothetical protein